MNAPVAIPVEPAAARDKRAAATPTPADLALKVRDQRFGRGTHKARWWISGDPVASAWFNALSATFPRGEGFFIDSVRACREGAPPQLEAEIRDFIKQEINHTREHLAFNRAALEAGYDLTGIEAHVEQMLALARKRPPVVNVAATMALEHYTALFAHELLANPAHLVGGEQSVAAMWRWHAIEEIEHKGVAFDTYLHATRGWPALRRWWLRSLMMLVISKNFIHHRVLDTLDLLAQDGITGWKAKRKVLAYLVWKPGFLRRIFWPWLAFFKPGFHPWDHDDRPLIAAAERELEPGTP
jgi:predicted metal-dependent hydrolase